MNEIVKISNKIYDMPLYDLAETDCYISFSTLNTIEIKTFIAIIHEACKTENSEIFIGLKELKNLIGESNRSNKEIVDRLSKVVSKFRYLCVESASHDKEGNITQYGYISIFPDVLINKNGLACSINPKGRFIFDKNFLIANGYTKVLMSMLYGMGKHEMLLGLYLSRYRNGETDESGKKYWMVSTSDMRKTLAIPEKYKFKEIRRYVLDPAIEHLSEYFDELEYTTFKTGSTVTAIKFSFKGINDGIMKQANARSIPVPHIDSGPYIGAGSTDETPAEKPWWDDPGQWLTPPDFSQLRDENGELVELPF